MKRRQFLPAMVGGVAAITALDCLRSRTAHATFLNDLLDSAIGSPSSPSAPSAPVYSEGASMFAEIYGEHYISREQYIRLQSGSATYWHEVAHKPYARIRSDDGYEHYYFPFNFGAGGVTIVSDTTGKIASWDIATTDLVPQFSPPANSEQNYPPQSTEVSAAPTAPAQPTGYPPLPEKQVPLGCY